ncbi:MAG: molybdenum cofactor guanylyltransferase [Deltaproteobacteria bacterium]|nr:molybdenum cofactor guanylyltransferase [Deltaproteobacteria bacterium]
MTGAILAGGLSRRMGSNKAFIKIDGTTIIERSVKLFREGFDDFFIVANDLLLYERLSVRVVSDIIKGAGSLGGIYTAVFHSKDDRVFVTACDMPSLDLKSIKKTAEVTLGGFDAIVPFIGGRFHPMHAVYSRRCLKPVKAMIDEGNLRVNDLFERVRVKKLTEDHFKGLPIESSVENINTREDLIRIGHTE